MANPEAEAEAEALLASVKAQGELIANMKKQGIVEKAKVIQWTGAHARPENALAEDERDRYCCSA